MRNIVAALLFLEKKNLKSPILVQNKITYTFAGSDLLNSCIFTSPWKDYTNLSFFPYKYPDVKRSIWSLKYSCSKEALTYFSDLVCDEIIAEVSENLLQEQVLILFIPSSAYAQGKRKWDQMEQLCLMMATNTALKHFACLIPRFFSQQKASIEQHTLKSRYERLQYGKLRLSIRDTSLCLKNRYIFIIDDVMTTGATLEQARTLCYERGAKVVYTISLSH